MRSLLWHPAAVMVDAWLERPTNNSKLLKSKKPNTKQRKTCAVMHDLVYIDYVPTYLTSFSLPAPSVPY